MSDLYWLITRQMSGLYWLITRQMSDLYWLITRQMSDHILYSLFSCGILNSTHRSNPVPPFNLGTCFLLHTAWHSITAISQWTINHIWINRNIQHFPIIFKNETVLSTHLFNCRISWHSIATTQWIVVSVISLNNKVR